MKRYYILYTSKDADSTGINSLGYWTGKTMTFQKEYELPYCTTEFEKNTQGFLSKKEAFSCALDCATRASEYVSYFQVVQIITFHIFTTEVRLLKRMRKHYVYKE